MRPSLRALMGALVIAATAAAAGQSAPAPAGGHRAVPAIPQFYRRHKRRQRRDNTQFQCAVRPPIKRAQAICRLAWSTLRQQPAKFLSCHCSALLWADCALRAWKTKTAPPNPGARHAIAHRETTFGDTGEGSLLGSKCPDRKLPGRGRAILAQPREESIDLRPGGTEVPLPAKADSRGAA